MKKIALLALAALLIAGPVYAGQSTNTIIDEEALLKTSSQAVSGKADIRGCEKVSFFVTANGTADTVSCEVSAEISYDGVNWLVASFKDFAGGDTLQTDESDIEGDYYMWLDTQQVTAPYVRISVALEDRARLSEIEGSTITVNIVKEQ